MEVGGTWFEYRLVPAELAEIPTIYGWLIIALMLTILLAKQ